MHLFSFKVLHKYSRRILCLETLSRIAIFVKLLWYTSKKINYEIEQRLEFNTVMYTTPSHTINFLYLPGKLVLTAVKIVYEVLWWFNLIFLITLMEWVVRWQKFCLITYMRWTWTNMCFHIWQEHGSMQFWK